MKICPKCYKSNPDNGKKCFFCGEDLREILPYVPQEEPQEPKIEEEKALDLAKERKVQEALLGIKEKYGKNAILKGLNFEEGATAKERNQQIGGHKA